MKLVRLALSSITFLGKSLLFLIVFLVTLNLTLTLVISPVYDFPEPEVFKGDHWHNPYTHIDSTAWKIANFQIQSRAWGGITDGDDVSSEDVFKLYSELGYDVVCISDYMKINTHKIEGKPYVPVYEHGYGLFKTHQVCIGAESVDFLDYPLYQTRNNKQFVLNQLSNSSKLVAIAHPSLRNAYTHRDLARLSNYDLLEALNNFQHSVPHWDAALSGGRPAYILANDDSHSLKSAHDYGRVITVFNSHEVHTDAVVDSLKVGNAYGMITWKPWDETHEKKVERFKHLPELTSVAIAESELHISANQPIQSVRFIGQDGVVVKEITENTSKSVSYQLQDSDTYVRAELTFDPGHVIYTNPVMRSETGAKPVMTEAVINWPATILYRTFLFLIMASLAVFVFVRKKKYFVPRWSSIAAHQESVKA